MEHLNNFYRIIEQYKHTTISKKHKKFLEKNPEKIRAGTNAPLYIPVWGVGMARGVHDPRRPYFIRIKYSEVPDIIRFAKIDRFAPPEKPALTCKICNVIASEGQNAAFRPRHHPPVCLVPEASQVSESR